MMDGLGCGDEVMSLKDERTGAKSIKETTLGKNLSLTASAKAPAGSSFQGKAL